MAHLAIVGSTVQDVVHLPGAPPRSKPGGAPLFAALALAHDGSPAAVATRCHDAHLLAPIVAVARPVCAHLDAGSVRSVLRYRADGERDHELAGLGSDWSEDDIEGWAAPALAAARWVHAGTQRAGDLGPGVLAALARGGRLVALDAQGPLREARTGPLRLTGRLDADLLRHVQALKLSETEADAAFGTREPLAIARSTGVPEVLVTLGRSGAGLAWEGSLFDLRADAVPDVDPTGAGDAFLGLYADARAGGADPPDAAGRACAGVARWLRAAAHG
jgi:sugar/nucleoside kinase (ribokinase family)